MKSRCKMGFDFFKYIKISVLIFTIVFYGCKINYSFTGASISPDIKSVSINYFPNNAALVQPTLSQTFTEALRDKFTSQTNLNLVKRNGDLQIEGAITDYKTEPLAIQAGSETAQLNRLTITVSVKFSNTLDEKQNYESNFTKYFDYNSKMSLSQAEVQGIKEITDLLVEEIFMKSLANW